MTAVTEAVATAGTAASDPPPITPRRDRIRGVLDLASAGSAALALLVWGLPVTHGAGGRDPWTVALGLLSVLPGLLVLQPWRRLPTWHVLVSVGPALAAVIVCLTAPTGWDGLDEAAALAYAAGLYLVVRCFARDTMRRVVVMVALAMIGLEQFTQSYLPWWGGGTVSKLMVGTFYWHNQFSAFMLGTGIVAGVLAVRGSGAPRLAGWLVAPWCFAALLFAGSRAGLATFVVVWLGVIVLSFVDRVGRVAVLAVLGAALALATLLTSPLLMDDAGWFTSTVQAREADQGVEGNGRARLALWRASVDLGLDRPVTGAGFDSFGGAGSARMPADAGLSIFVHNGYLQAFSDGGLLLLSAVVLATGMPLLAGLRMLMSRRRRTDVAAVAVPAALLALVLHSGVDFDWVYPALLGLFAVLAGLLPLSGGADRPARRTTAQQWAVAALLLVVTVAALPAAARASALRAPDADRPWWAGVAVAGVPLSGPVDVLPAVSLCRRELYSEDRSDLRHGIACTAHAAQDDPGLALLRARAQVLLGDPEGGLRRADAVIAQFGERRPTLRISHASVLAAAGDDAAARHELLDLRAELTRRGLSTESVDQALLAAR